jgi:hypothetical protein
MGKYAANGINYSEKSFITFAPVKTWASSPSRLGWNGFLKTNTIAYLSREKMKMKKSFAGS